LRRRRERRARTWGWRPALPRSRLHPPSLAALAGADALCAPSPAFGALSGTFAGVPPHAAMRTAPSTDPSDCVRHRSPQGFDPSRHTRTASRARADACGATAELRPKNAPSQLKHDNHHSIQIRFINSETNIKQIVSPDTESANPFRRTADPSKTSIFSAKTHFSTGPVEKRWESSDKQKLFARHFFVAIELRKVDNAFQKFATHQLASYLIARPIGRHGQSPHPADSQGARFDQPLISGFAPPCGSMTERQRGGLSFRNRNTRKGRANGGRTGGGTGATHQPTKFSYEGFQAPTAVGERALSSRRRERSRPRSSLEGTGALQGEPGSDGENLYLGRLRETTRGVRGTRRGDFTGGNRRLEPSLSGPRPMSHDGQYPACSEPSRARSRRQRLRGPNREWSSR
jgi:hypothetical protein